MNSPMSENVKAEAGVTGSESEGGITSSYESNDGVKLLSKIRPLYIFADNLFLAAH